VDNDEGSESGSILLTLYFIIYHLPFTIYQILKTNLKRFF